MPKLRDVRGEMSARCAKRLKRDIEYINDKMGATVCGAHFGSKFYTVVNKSIT